MIDLSHRPNINRLGSVGRGGGRMGRGGEGLERGGGD